jgi:hypothetical protein
MSACPLCIIKPIVTSLTPAFCIETPVTKTENYSCVVNIKSPILSTTDFAKDARFSPAARLTLHVNSAAQLLSHREVWRQMLQLSSEHAVVFESVISLTNLQLARRVENATLAKDWDVLMVSKTEYFLTRRAAAILYKESHQFHHNLIELLNSIPHLKVVYL